jgi:glycerol-3-phosphate dehydrogenase
MRRELELLAKTTFDLAVIGGGINGAAVAREAALRGLKVALVEAADFASGTSSRSSKLIHGGLRYLEQFDFKLVYEARTERRLLLKLAPHLAQPLPFLLPIYEGDPYFPLKIRAGLALYDLLGNLGREDRHRMLSSEETRRLVPALRGDGLRAGAVYHDSETDDARLTVENALDAADHGAVVANYAELRALEAARVFGEPPAVRAAEIEDRLTGRRLELRARFWVNATGPWVDRVRALLAGFDGSKTIRLTKGTHLILPPVSDEYALFAAVHSDKRIFLLLPWCGYALLGTTDTDYEGDPVRVRPDSGDVAYLLAAVNRVLCEPYKSQQVLGSFAGLRALVLEPDRQARRKPSAVSREYRFHFDPWASNFVSICGGKLTTARALAEKVIELACDRLRMGGISPTSRDVPLPGGHTGPFDAFLKSAVEDAAREFRIPPEVATRIVRTYGSRWRSVLAPIREHRALGEILPGKPALLAAEVDFAIREEMALTVEDFLLRRSGLNWAACTPVSAKAAPAVAEILARRFAWSEEQTKEQLNAFTNCPRQDEAKREIVNSE